MMLIRLTIPLAAFTLLLFCGCSRGGESGNAVVPPAVAPENIPVAIVPVVAAAPEASKKQLPPVDNLHRVDKYVLRSGQPGKKDFIALEEYGVKSVLNLRFYHDDEDEAGETGLLLFRAPMNAGSITKKQLFVAMRMLDAAPKPVLVHCWHGSDRTGTVIAAYRIVRQGYTVDEALKELTEGGFGYHSIYDNIPKLLRSIDWKAFKARLDEKPQDVQRE